MKPKLDFIAEARPILELNLVQFSNHHINTFKMIYKFNLNAY